MTLGISNAYAAATVGRLLQDPARPFTDLIEQVRQIGAGLSAAYWLALMTVLGLTAAGWMAVRGYRARRLRGDARQVRILAPPQVDPDGAQALWTNLHDLLRPRWRRAIGDQPYLAFEYVWSTDGLAVSLWVPRAVPPGLVERAVEAAWPGARTTAQDADPPVPPDHPCVGGTLRLAAPEWFPLRTDHPADPLRALIGAAGIPDHDEAAAVQILSRPVTGRRVARCHRAARALRTGRPTRATAKLLDALTPGPPPPPQRASDDPSRNGDIRVILDKAASPGWEVAIRYAVTAADADDRGPLRGRAHALASAFALFTGRNRLARHHLRKPGHALATRRMRSGDLMSVPELAALAHLPTDTTVPGLARAGANAVPPPVPIPATGKVLGDAEVGPRRPVAINVADCRYHLHLLGATGSGKSTLLTNLILSDVHAGRGAVVIDPKGDLIADILDRLPARAANRLVLLDPDETQAPPSLNMLEGGDPELVVDHLVGIFRRIFEHYWGPRTDDVLRAACLTLLQRPGATLADVPQLLSHAARRRVYIDGLTDPVLRGFWDWYEQLSEAEQARVVGPVMNKLRAFLLRRFARQVVGSDTSSFDMRDVLDGGICLVRIPKGILGDETAQLLGSFVVAKVWQAATARARQGQHTRVDASLYVDECHNFLNLPRSFDDMLAEARGYRLSLVLAHQHLAQLPRDLREAVSANARNKLFFAVSPEDARALERHVAPQLTGHDLSHLDAYQVAARLVVAGAEQPAFTLRTRPASPPIPGRAEDLRAAARARYGRTSQQRQRSARRQPSRRADPRQSAGRDPTGVPGGGSTGGSGGESGPAGGQLGEPAGRAGDHPAGGSRDSRTYG